VFAKEENSSYFAIVDGILGAFEAEIEKRNLWEVESWLDVLERIEQEQIAAQTFKNPAVLRYIEKLQEHLLQTGVVGKSTSVSDLVKKVYYELMEGDKQYNVIPETASGVAQTYLSFQNSHKPGDLWHLVTPDYSKANLWLQLRSGDNKDMERVKESVEQFLRDEKPPVLFEVNWAGLTYINTVWQQKMVFGMLKSLMGSFVIVAVMMMFLFRSFWWGLISMVPLSVTIAFIYGIIGWTGKDYDMPVAVLSSLTLGLSIDFAIHFIERLKAVFAEKHSLRETFQTMYKEPARAIARNAIVITIGFLPLLVAPLMPYKTVGLFISAIMAFSASATLVILPALICMMRRFLLNDRSDLGGECQ
jgi:predicted RND superfamily exporter protein